MGGCIITGGCIKWLDYGVLETILLYRLGWDFCILAVIGRWLLCSGGCLLRFHCNGMGLMHHLTTPLLHSSLTSWQVSISACLNFFSCEK